MALEVTFLLIHPKSEVDDYNLNIIVSCVLGSGAKFRPQGHRGGFGHRTMVSGSNAIPLGLATRPR